MARSKFVSLFFVASLLSLLMPLAIAFAHSEGGSVVISDGSSVSDAATITLTLVPALAEGESYEGWFVSADGNTRVSTGVITVDGDSATQSFASEVNLISTYGAFEVTQQPSGEVVYRHAIAEGDLAIVRAAAASADSLKSQIAVAQGHAANAVAATTLASVQEHAANVISTLDGVGGAIEHAASLGTSGSSASASSDAHVSANAQALITAAGNAGNWVNQANDLAGNANTSTNYMAANLFMQSASTTLSHALAESNAAHLASQGLAGYVLAVVEPAPPPTGDPFVPNMALWAVIVGLALVASGSVIFVGHRSKA